ncbi:MAG: hypothetical protein ACRD0J_03570, partial [Acidimicrobiales bacterium]
MILALVEHSEGTPAGPSLEALTLGRRLAEALGEPLHAVAVGSRAEATAIAAGAHGAAVLHAVDYDGSGDYAPRAWAHAVAQLMDAAQAGGAQAGGADAGGADAGGATPAVVAAAGQVSA